MRHLYSAILYLALPFVLFRLIVQSVRQPAYRVRWYERLGILNLPPEDKPVIWLHAVSVGEVKAALPLIELLESYMSHYNLVISTVTPTGAEILDKSFGGRFRHVFLPYDLPYSMKRFLNTLRPKICIVLETEIWPNMYCYCHAANIPIIIANARLSEKSLSGYQHFQGLIKDTLACVDRVVAQSATDAERFELLGCDPSRIEVGGNLKFDINVSADREQVPEQEAHKDFGSRPVWVAASTHDGEEDIVLEAFQRVLEEFPDCLLLIAPRHPQRFDKVAQLCTKRGFSLGRESQTGKDVKGIQVLLIDSIGELQNYFPLVDLAFIGGSITARGGHNMLEPAVHGKPVISGPNYLNFVEIARLLLDADALIVAGDASSLAESVVELLYDPGKKYSMGNRAREAVYRNNGASRKTLTVIQALCI